MWLWRWWRWWCEQAQEAGFFLLLCFEVGVDRGYELRGKIVGEWWRLWDEWVAVEGPSWWWVGIVGGAVLDTLFFVFFLLFGGGGAGLLIIY